MDHDLTTLSEAQVGFINHDALERILEPRPALSRALWRETLVECRPISPMVVNLGRDRPPVHGVFDQGIAAAAGGHGTGRQRAG